jgi:ribosomal protein S18 acetylase RimI-like enzyme
MPSPEDQTSQGSEIIVKYLHRSDVPSLTLLEQTCGFNPWTEKDIAKVLFDETYVGIAALKGDQITAYTVFEMDRIGVSLLRLVVAPGADEKESVLALRNKLITKLAPSRNSINIDVCERDDRTISLLKDLGFRALGIKKHDRGDNADDDAYVMRYKSSRLHRK